MSQQVAVLQLVGVRHSHPPPSRPELLTSDLLASKHLST